jgi:DNA topoisomerase-1
MNILVIVESPSKCKKIEQYLNSQPAKGNKLYTCIASYGHIRELKGLEAINLNNNFEPTFTACVSKKDQIAKIKKAIKAADEVILGSDDDREGEAIAWHLCQLFNLSLETTQRILFHEITEAALHHAIKTPTRVNLALVNAQLGRQVLDIMVGYKLSPLLWKHVQDGLSAGRCQTPALRLLYENQREMAAAPGKQSYVVTGYFTNKNIPFVLNHEESDEQQMREFLQSSLTYQHQYRECSLRKKTCAPPEPFTTSTLQQAASNELHLSPKETMSYCQSLYEGGFITYPRTDSRSYSEEFKEKVKAYIEKTYGQEALAQTQALAAAQTPAVAQALAVAQTQVAQAHEAIRPTDIKCEELAETTGKEARLYRLIRRRTLESSMAAATLSVLTAIISAPHNHEYRYSAEQTISAGWKIVGGNTETNKEYTYLQTLKVDQQIMPYQKIKATVHLKELKQHYSEARLIQLLEEKGIGRPSTFASLLEKIQERKYVKKENIKGQTRMCMDMEIEKSGTQIKTVKQEREFGAEKNKLVITEVGVMALEFLLKHFDPFFQYTYTKEMEDALDQVAQNQQQWQEVCKKCYTELEHLSSTILQRGKETIKIDANHTYMVGKYGPVIKHLATADKAAKADEKKQTFKAVRKDIDLNKLRRGEYTLAEVVESDDANPVSIGDYENKPVYIKVGKFGTYLEWNNKTKSLNQLKKTLDTTEITMDMVVEVLYDLANTEENVLRIINKEASIRKGKYGNYIYYKNKKMKKPRFLKLDDFGSGDYLTCELELLADWLKKTYKINE